MEQTNKLGKGPWRAPRGKKWILLFVPLVACSAVFFYFFTLPPSPPPALLPPAVSPQPASQEPEIRKIEGEVKEKSTLFKALAERNVPLHWVDLIISKLKPFLNFKKLKGGTFQLITDMKGDLVKFTYDVGPTEAYEVEKEGSEYHARKKKVLLQTYLVKVVGEIRSSLFEAMESIGEGDALTVSFAEILAWEIDFYKDVREGDGFKVIVEKIYKGDEFIQYGTIHAVEYLRGERALRGIRYKNDFYNEKGFSLQKSFLKSPLRFTRISSRFTKARKHPILGGVLPHYGVDYAAPVGTPIWAVADGTVASCSWNGGFGKQVVLRHRNGYLTYYGHLSGFGSGIRVNQAVRQKQVIGYVGSTGLSTGPHLDYRLSKDGRFRNPLLETFPVGFPIDRAETKSFEARRDEMMAWLEGDNSIQKKLAETEPMSP